MVSIDEDGILGVCFFIRSGESVFTGLGIVSASLELFFNGGKGVDGFDGGGIEAGFCVESGTFVLEVRDSDVAGA